MLIVADGWRWAALDILSSRASRGERAATTVQLDSTHIRYSFMPYTISVFPDTHIKNLLGSAVYAVHHSGRGAGGGGGVLGGVLAQKADNSCPPPLAIKDVTYYA